MEVALLEKDVVPQLWNAYKKTPEYKSGLKKAISSNNKLIIEREKEGLKIIYKKFVTKLLSYKNNKDELLNRKAGDWENEWKNMHKMLFSHILTDCGKWRMEPVRFGSPGDEELYRIPKIGTLHHEIAVLADHMQSYLIQDQQSAYTTLAKFHYQFIRIHPFKDGNGRIARAITDQLAIYFGFPPAMGGFPRHDSKRRESYHKAIKACITDSECKDLALWIENYISLQLNSIA